MFAFGGGAVARDGVAGLGGDTTACGFASCARRFSGAVTGDAVDAGACTGGGTRAGVGVGLGGVGAEGDGAARAGAGDCGFAAVGAAAAGEIGAVGGASEVGATDGCGRGGVGAAGFGVGCATEAGGRSDDAACGTVLPIGCRVAFESAGAALAARAVDVGIARARRTGVGFAVSTPSAATALAADFSVAVARVVRRGVVGFGASTIVSSLVTGDFVATRRRVGFAAGGDVASVFASVAAPADSSVERAPASPSPAVLRRRVGGFGRSLSSMRRV
jgi:hypothetical protein